MAFSRSRLDGDLLFFPVVQSAAAICRLWCVSLPYPQLDTNLMPKRGSTLHHYQRQAFPEPCGCRADPAPTFRQAADRRADRTINRNDQPSFSGRESDGGARLNESWDARRLAMLYGASLGLLHEKSSQIGVPTFADPEQFLLTTGGMFPWNYPDPGRELSAKGRSVANRRNDCGRRNRSDARNRKQPLAGPVFASSFLDHCIGFVDPCFQSPQGQARYFTSTTSFWASL